MGIPGIRASNVAEAVTSLAETLTPVTAGPAETRYQRPRAQTTQQEPPESIRAESRAMLEVDRIGVPPALLAALKHLASLHNPEYYEKERLRFSTWNTPRFLRCYGETIDRLLLPRGVRDQAERIVADAGSTLKVVEACGNPESIDGCSPGTWTMVGALPPADSATGSRNFGTRLVWRASASTGSTYGRHLSGWPGRPPPGPAPARASGRLHDTPELRPRDAIGRPSGGRRHRRDVAVESESSGHRCSDCQVNLRSGVACSPPPT